jgi:hypothetical protein
MHEAHGVGDMETAAAVVVASKDTAVAAVDADKRTAASTTRAGAAVVVCSKEPRH